MRSLRWHVCLVRNTPSRRGCTRDPWKIAFVRFSSQKRETRHYNIFPFLFPAAVCRPGYYSRRKRYHGSRVGMKPCFACDFGFYQPNYGQSQCLPCPSNVTTEKRGSIDISDCLPIRDEEIDDCRTDPCLNGGRCLRDESGYVCECREYYVGTLLVAIVGRDSTVLFQSFF